MKPTIIWFRQDLRLSDNLALNAAIQRGGSVICLYIQDFSAAGNWAPGGASQWWLHHSLHALAKRIDAKTNRLILRSGDSQAILDELLESTGAEAVYWNRRYTPWGIEQDKHIKSGLQKRGIDCQCFNSHLLYEPWEIETKQGDPYQVFTPFWRRCQELTEPDSPTEEPAEIPRTNPYPESLELEALQLRPKVDWAGGLRETWTPGEQGAQERLTNFLDETLYTYDQQRDIPSERGTSELSPHLHFGEISPRDIWHQIRRRLVHVKDVEKSKSAWKYLAELGWREFGHHILYYFPHTPESPLRQQFASFPWREAPQQLKAWQKGQTGYPLVDAGMRQLWHTGWMHNRVRMVVASFLVKDLRISWLHGAKWFWDTLVDADLANNTLGWQWAGGCGADAAPYFRIFNPVLQSKKFDESGKYIRKWVPELRDMPTKHLHAPWEAPTQVLKNTSIELGKTYPKPLVDHGKARDEALAAFEKVKNATSSSK